MGADVFFQDGKGATAKEAFNDARDQAAWEHGHGGYTGSLAEKYEYVMIKCPEGVNPREYADDLINNRDTRVDDKWGPAGCIKLEDNKYLFFGWASS